MNDRLSRTGVFLFILSLLPCFPAKAALHSFPADTTRADTTAVRDSARTSFMPALGDLQLARDTTAFHWRRFVWTDARFSGDLFGFAPGIFLRELGEPGRPPQVTIDGLDWRRIAFSLDGRPISDPVTGTYNLYDIPIEFIDHIEIIHGPRAFLFGSSGTGGSVNFVTRQYDTNRPITKIRFMQGPYEHLLTDGLYTQNVARGINLMIGFLRHVTDGRYANAKFDFWNVRSRIRYNISDRLNVVLSDFYTRSVTGVNGGVLPDATVAGGLDVFQGTEAIVRSANSDQTQTRRDVSASVVGKFFADSSWTTHGRIYYSALEREFSDPDTAFPAGLREFSWKVLGASARQNIAFDGFDFLLGAECEQRAVSPPSSFGRTLKNYYAWYGKSEVGFLDGVVPAVFARGEKLEEGEAFSYGFDLHLTLTSELAFEGGYSKSYRFPTSQETNWGVYVVPAGGQLDLLERHKLLQVGCSFDSPVASLSGSASLRTINNAIVHRLMGSSSDETAIEAVPEVKVRSFSGLASLTLWKFIATGTLTFSEIEEQAVIKLVNPKFVLTGELAYRDDLFNGALGARVAARSRYMSKHQGMRFLPSQIVHVENPARALNAFSTLDLSGVFRIGEASIHITWENVLNKRYFITPTYPVLDRNIKIGVNWVFLD